MKGDFSRRTFDATKHYSAVLVEQGRLLTDADSEEQHRIVEHRHEAVTTAVVGDSGGPMTGAGFALSSPDSAQLLIGAGRYFVAGALVENESEVDYAAQPDRFDVPWPLPAGRHAILLEVWRRLVTALDDPAIREIALGGPTTSVRERVTWQVTALPVAADWVCSDPPPEAETTTGRLAARAEPDAALPTPCLIPPQAGYTGLENQLYRVEVLGSGEAYDIVAAPDVVAITDVPAGQPNQVVVAALGSLAIGDPVEVYRTGAGSDPLEATFGQVTDLDAATGIVTLSVALPVFEPGDGPILRRVGATYVVSRDNGSVTTGITAIDGVEVSVHDLGPDDVLGFAVGQLVEISDDRVELARLPRHLHQIADIDVARRIVVLRTPAEPLAVSPDGVDPDRHPKLRRWDAAGAVRLRPDGSGWIHLENGVQIRFVDGHYRSGDHWVFPARAATVDPTSGTIEWPSDAGAPAERDPAGVERQRCVLGYLDVDDVGTITGLVDCRRLFPPLTALRTLLYVGGDGQEASLAGAIGGFLALPGRLAVRVANGSFPVPGATVRFAIGMGAGRLDGGGATADVITDPDGIASTQWEIDTVTDHQLCIAQLLSPAGTVIAHQVVQFHAGIDRDAGGRRGCCWSVGPEGDYQTIEEALTDLLRRDIRDICLCLMAGDHEFSGGAMEIGSEKMRFHLSLHACGRGTRVLITKRWTLTGWASIRIRDVDLHLIDDASLDLRDVTDVELSGCHVFGLRPDGALVSVQGFVRLGVSDCLLVARRRDSFEGIRPLLESFDQLARLLEVPEEWKLAPTLRESAVQLAGLDTRSRRALGAKLLELANDRGIRERLTNGEWEATGTLGVILADSERELPWPGLARILERLVRAATVARGGCALEVGPAPGVERAARLAAPGVSVLLTGNDIQGTLTFYGRGEPHFFLPEDTVKQLDGLLGEAHNVVGGFGGEVHVRDNRIGRVVLSAEMIAALNQLVQDVQPFWWAYESFHLTSNVIDDVVNEILARHLAVTGNDFTLDAIRVLEQPSQGTVANVIGDTATYTSNHARLHSSIDGPARIIDATRASAEAANVDLRIL